MSWCASSWVYPVWDCLGFLDLVAISFSILGKFLTIISSNIFSSAFLLSSSSGMPMIQILGVFNIVPEVSEAVLISFYPFLCSASFISTILSSISLILSSV